MQRGKLIRRIRGSATLKRLTRMDDQESNVNRRCEQWKDWIQSHGAQLLLFARQRTRSLEDAEDLVQSAIMRLWRADPTCSCPKIPLVIRAIRWGAIDQGRQISRRQERERDFQQTAELVSGSFFEFDFEAQERGRIVQEALQELDAAQREVIILKVWGGMTATEIAEALEISANTVSSRYRYGLSALKKRLGAVLS